MSQYSENSLAEDKNTAWQQVLDLIGDDLTILDVGCSSGNLGAELKEKKNATVDGIEIDEADAKLASKKLRQVEVLNVETEPSLAKIFTSKYDAILLIDVIEHLVNPAAALRQLQHLLKSNGKIIFSIPNMAHLSVRFALMEGDFTYTQAGLLDKTHLHFYTGQEIQRVFTEANLEIKTFTSSSLRYPPLLLEKKINAYGLTITDQEKFLGMLEKTSGYVYQYIGIAIPAKTPVKQPPVPKTNPHEKDYKIIEATITNYQNHVSHLEESVKLKDQHIKNLEKIIEDLKRETVISHMRTKRKSKKQL
jgi:2-polyprenyl-3-methyl-5-hydroxy-6-metoxy-1,4-benzoquinol methylase